MNSGNGFGSLRLMTVDEVAEIFRVSKASVYRWAERGLLPAVMVGRIVRFSGRDVEQLLKRALDLPPFSGPVIM